MTSIATMKKPDLVKLCTKLKQELKLKEKQNNSNISIDDLPDFALSYREEREGDVSKYLVYILKIDLDSGDARVYKTIEESTKELALYKLELSIIDYLDNQTKEIE